MRGIEISRVLSASASSAAAQPVSLQELVPSDTARASDLKRRIASLAGSQNGTDLDTEQRSEIDGLIKQMEDLNPASHPASVDLTGSEWRLVYSSSVAASAGKFGPFVGRVWQDFPAESKWQYFNCVSFGPLKAKLLADYQPTPGRDNRLDVKFVNTIFLLGPLQFKMDMSNDGWWRLSYVDNDWRILYANTGNVFVLAR